MLRVYLEDRFGIRHALTRGLEHACQIRAYVVIIGDKTRRRIGQPARGANILDTLAKAALDRVDQRLDLGRLLVARLSLYLVLERAEIEAALRNGHQGLPLEFSEVADHPFVDAIRQQQDFDALLTEHLEMRAVLRGVESFRRHVVDLVL